MYENQIAKGMALLDEKRPGWKHEINLERLNIASLTKCVLGQLYGSALRGMDMDTLALPTTAELVAHGFLSVEDWHSHHLTSEWHAAIQQRLKDQSCAS